MHPRSPRFHRLLMLTGLLTLSATLVAAQSYTYTTVDVPFVGATDTYVRGLAQGGTLTGVYRDAAGTLRSFLGKPDAEQKLTYRTTVLEANDVNPGLRVVGTYGPANGGGQRGFSLRGGTFTPLVVETWYSIYGCSVNDQSLIACTVFDGEYLWGTLFVGGTVIEHVAGQGAEGTYADFTWIAGLNNLNDLVGSIVHEDPEPTGVWLGWMRGGSLSPTPGKEYRVQAPCGGATVIRDVNDARLMAVTCGAEPWGPDEPEVSYAFDPAIPEVWTPLQVPGALATHVTRVNNHGHFVGWYQGTDGHDHGFLAVPSLVIAQP